MTNHFMLFPSCVPVRGATNSAIYDLARHRLILFPTAYFDVLVNIDRTVIEESIREFYSDSQRSRVEDLVQYLVDSEVAFFTEAPSHFPDLDEKMLSPSVIHNSVIDVDGFLHDFELLFRQLDALGCEYIQVRGFSSLVDPNVASLIAKAACDTSIRSVEILTRYDPKVGNEQWVAALRQNKILSHLTLHSAPGNSVTCVSATESDDRIIQYAAAQVRSASVCGVIQLGEISAPSIAVYLETKRFNGCLNKKIAISADGAIRNCPSMARSFGVAGITTLEEVADNAEFRRAWALRKDDIKVCKDCEFRYVCTDCRAYVVDPSDELSKPAKCSYDPYTGKWSGPNRERAVGRFDMRASPGIS